MSRSGPNRVPTSADHSSINWFIHQEQDLIAVFRRLEIASQMERARMADKCATLQRTFTSTEALRGACFQIRSSNDSFIQLLTTELTAQESDIAVLSEWLPSTLAFLRGLETVKNAAIALQAALEEQLGFIGQRVTTVEEEMEVTKELSGHMSHSIGVFSTAVAHAQVDIVATSRSFLHPIRRLPAEILQHIFEECVDTEAAEWFLHPVRPPTLLKSAIRIAGTCRSWRTIAQQTPRMWNRLRAPIRVKGVKKKSIIGTNGLEAFQESLRLCGSVPLEVTIPGNASVPENLNFMSMNIDRLNLWDTRRVDLSPYSFPSPRHLWVGQANPIYPDTQSLPSSLISRTTTITAHNVTVVIPEGRNLVTRLVLCGVQDGSELTSLLKSLPSLNELDAGDASMLYQRSQDHPAVTHQKLRHLRIHIDCMHDLEHCLADGLQLPSLNCFGLVGLWGLEEVESPHYTPSAFPSVSAQLPTTVTHIEVHGEYTMTTSSTSNLIEAFYRIDTISTYGNAVGVILSALCQIRGIQVGERSSTEESLPRSIQVLHVHDYFGDGQDLYPGLHQIYNSIDPIKIFFENCPNILPALRREFTHIRTTDARPSH